MRILSLCVREPWASMLLGLLPGFPKSIETRSWAPVWHGQPFRGPLLIVASKKVDLAACALLRIDPARFKAIGVALGIVELTEVRRMRPGDWRAACCEPYRVRGRDVFGWHMRNPRTLLKPWETVDLDGRKGGRLGLFEVELPAEMLAVEARRGAAEPIVRPQFLRTDLVPPAFGRLPQFDVIETSQSSVAFHA